MVQYRRALKICFVKSISKNGFLNSYVQKVINEKDQDGIPRCAIRLK